MAADRQPKMRAMIMADTEEERRAALDELLPLQQEDFEGIFEAMERAAGDDPAARPAAARVPARTPRSSPRRSSAPAGEGPTTWRSSSARSSAHRSS